jgi:adenylyl cyclase-associated protein
VDVELHHSLLITKCRNTTIRVNGKANAISIDSSSKLSIIIDSLVSSVDVIKCPSFALQILETVPTVLLDQVDGAMIYLSKDSLDTEVLTSKCTAVNVYFPPSGADEDDYKENNVPEQFRSFIKDGQLVTEIMVHSG